MSEPQSQSETRLPVAEVGLRGRGQSVARVRSQLRLEAGRPVRRLW